MGGRRYLRPRTLFKQWLDAMPQGTVVAEVVSHLSAPGEPLSTAHAVRMLKLAAEHGVPAVLTNAVRYCAEDGAATADVLDSARTLKSLPGTDRGTAAAAERPGMAEIGGPNASAGQGDHPCRRLRCH